MTTMSMRRPLRIGEFDVEPDLNRLRKGSQEQAVEPRVMDLLVLLAESPGEVLSRTEILERVWPETAVQDDALRRVVTVLRRTLGDDSKQPRYIETITRRGYRLVAPVSYPEAPDSGASGAGVTTERREPVPSPRRAVFWVAAAALVVAVAFGLVWTGRSGDAAETPAAEDPVELRPLSSLPGHEWEPEFAPDGRSVAFLHRLDGETALRIQELEGNESSEILKRARLSTPAWSPDGTRVLSVAGGRGECEVLSADVSGQAPVEVLYTCADGELLDRALQPDDRTLIVSRRPARYGSPWRVHRYDLTTRESVQLTLPVEPGSGDIFMTLSPDRRRVAIVRHLIGDHSKMVILDWSTGEEQIINRAPDTTWRVSWGHDGESLILAEDAGLYRLDLETGEMRWLVSSPQELRQPSGSPAGPQIAAVEQRFRAEIIRRPNPLMAGAAGDADADAVELEVEVVASSTRRDFRPRFGPNRDRLAFVSGRSGRSEIWVTRPDGGLERLFGVDPPNHVHEFLWSPAGDRLAVSDHQQRLMTVDVATGDVQVLPGSPFSGQLLDWSSDGSTLYRLEVTDGSPEAWAVRLDGSGRRQVTRCGVRAAQESPDGKALYVTRLHTRGLWRVELGGDGQATEVLEDVLWFAWTVTDRGLYTFESFVEETGIYFREAVVGEPTLVLPLPAVKLDFSVSDDHRWLAYAEASEPDGDLILIDGLPSGL
ncbi:MAG: winged helix-turn-helix domain-containing protein [Acidobacteriota bacterium]